MAARSTNRTATADAGKPPRVTGVDVGKYEVWRAAKDLDDVIYALESRDRMAPASFYRLRRTLRGLARSQGIEALQH